MKRLAIAWLAAAPLVVNPMPAGPCLRLEPAVEAITGRLELLTFPGPPNYGDVSKGDRPETSLFLGLTTSRCVEGARSDDLTYEQHGTALIQLVVSSAQFTRYQRLVGNEVTAVGRLFPAHTGRHHTPVLLTVATLSDVK